MRTARLAAIGPALSAVVCGALLLFAPGCYGDVEVTVSGHVRDQNGNPISEARVTLSQAPNWDSGPLHDARPTNESGEFVAMITFSPMEDDRQFILRVEKEGFLPYQEQVSDGVHSNKVITLKRKGAQ